MRNFAPSFNPVNPKETFPYIGINQNFFLIPIYPEYHTNLLPDSFLRTESPSDYIEHEPHRNAISKVYISRSIERGIQTGDVIIFYRTASGGSGYYTSVITTIAIAESKVDNIQSEVAFISLCRKRSVFSDEELKKHWNFGSKPFIINFLYVHTFPEGKRMNRKSLLEHGILTGAENEIRGLKRITKEQFLLIIGETHTDESIIVD